MLARGRSRSAAETAAQGAARLSDRRQLRRQRNTIETVQEALSALAARYRADEVLTAVKHIPAREAQFRAMPAWVRPELAAGVPRQRHRKTLFAPGRRGGTRARREKLRGGDADGVGQNALLQPAGAERGARESATRARSISSPPRRWRRTNSRNCTIWRKRLDDCFGVFTYDGDTPSDARKAIRERGHVILSNPDMLHTGILPHHTKWMRLFENLRYIVLDELHTYRGVFGSHLANVLRRLARIARFYGSEPQFICCSATIANPGELAAQLIEKAGGGGRGKWRAGGGEAFRFLQSADGEPQPGNPPQLFERNDARGQGTAGAQAADDRLRQ